MPKVGGRRYLLADEGHLLMQPLFHHGDPGWRIFYDMAVFIMLITVNGHQVP